MVTNHCLNCGQWRSPSHWNKITRMITSWPLTAPGVPPATTKLASWQLLCFLCAVWQRANTELLVLTPIFWGKSPSLCSTWIMADRAWLAPCSKWAASHWFIDYPVFSANGHTKYIPVTHKYSHFTTARNVPSMGKQGQLLQAPLYTVYH